MSSIWRVPIILLIFAQIVNGYVTNGTDIHIGSELNKLKCLFHLISKHPCHTIVTVVVTGYDMDYFYQDLNDNICFYTVIRTMQSKDGFFKSNIYVISVENFKHFIETITATTKDLMWNPGANFIIYINEIDIDEEVLVFRKCYELNIFNAILLKNIKNKIEVLTFSPYNCAQIKNTINLGQCVKLDILPFHSIEQLEAKILHNCSIKVAIIEDEPFIIFDDNEEFEFLGDKRFGVEQYILNNIGLRENISIDYVYVNQNVGSGIILPNRTFTGSLAFLQNKSAIAVAGGFFMTLNRAAVLDFIWGYHYSDIYIIASDQENTIWKRIYKQFNYTIWTLIAFTYVVATMIVIIVHEFFYHHRNRQLTALRMWGYLYGNTDQKLFKLNNLRMIIIFWIWFSFFINSFYNTALYSIITGAVVDDKMEPNISQFRPCIRDNFRHFFKFSYNETLPGESLEECQSIHDALDLLARSGDVYTLETDYGYFYHKYQYTDEDGRILIEVLDKRFRSVILNIYFNKGFPLLHKFQKYVLYFSESGLVSKRLDEIFFEETLFKQKEHKIYKIIKLVDFKGHFLILGIGYLISFVTLIIEVIIIK